jgi:PST family polysaccharide transporter
MDDSATPSPPPPAATQAASSAVFLGASQIIRLVLTTLSTIVISRLLSPGDYGVIAMAAPVTGFILMFQDLGLSSATIQKRTISDRESNALFWINVYASLAISVALVLIAPLAGWFYHDVRAAYVVAASAAAVLVTGPSMQQSALLNRNMRFAALSTIDVVNAFATFCASALAAYFLRSYWALVAGALVGALIQTAMIWAMSPWRPSGRPSFTGLRELVRFGGHVTGFNVVNYLVRNADNVMIAKFVGTSALGLYDRSYKLMTLPLQTLNGPVSRLLVPALSRLQDDPERYRRTFLFALRALMLASVPAIAVATACSNQLMPFLLGARWAGAGPIFFWLGLAALPQPLSNLTGVLFVSSGSTKTFMQWGVFSAVVTLAGFAVGLRWGAIGVAMSLFFTIVARVPILFAVCVRGTSVKQGDLYACMLEALAGAAIAAVITVALGRWLTIAPVLCLALPLSYLCALAIGFLTPDGRGAIAQLWSMGITLWDSLGNRLGMLAHKRL